ncbi:MAG: hypothetical protein AAF934_05155 [Bacteroidota bacterium]
MSSISPYISAFSLELQSPNVILNVREANDKAIGGIDVSIRSGGQVFKAIPSSKGFFQGTAIPSVISTININTKGFQPYVQKFILTNKVLLDDPESPLILKIHDHLENAIEEAQITVSSIAHSETFITNEEGMIEGDYMEGFENTITIKKEGFVDHRFVLPAFTKVFYDDVAFISIPVINLEPEPVEL